MGTYLKRTRPFEPRFPWRSSKISIEQISPSLEKASHRARVVASFGTWEILTPTVSQWFQGSHRAGAEVGVRPVDSDDVDILGNEDGQRSGGRKTKEEWRGERDIEGGRSREN